jgi:hypothetical protein
VKRLVLGLGILVVAGCGGGARVIAWKPFRPPIAPAPRLASPCHASDLSWSPHDFEGPVGWVGATGNLGTSIVVRNVSGHPCSLVGRPRLRFAGADTREFAISAYSQDPINRAALSSLRALGPGKEARVELWWMQSWCGNPPAKLRVTLLAGRSTKTFLNNGAPRCNDPAARQSTITHLGVSTWVPVLLEPPALPLRVQLLGRKGSHGFVVYHVRRGHVLRYQVAVTNVSKKPYTFGRCPFYEVTLDRAQAFVLNCRPVGTLAPGARAVFEMRMRVDRPIGGFLWSLNAANDLSDHAEVVVTR